MFTMDRRCLILGSARAAVAAAPPPPPPPHASAPPAPTTTPVRPVESTSVPPPAPIAQKKPAVLPPAESESWIDWVAAHWWMPAAVIVALFAVLMFAAWRRRTGGGDFPEVEGTDLSGFHDPTAKLAGMRRRDDSFVVEESGEHRMPEFDSAPESLADTHDDVKVSDDTMSSESAVNLDQGDPLAEADFHMAYGLYDQAADLV